MRLDILAIRGLNARLVRERGVRLALRLGIHTGLVVIGTVGGGGRPERLAFGDTPNIATRLQDLAQPDTVMLSHATYQLVRGYIVCQELGERELQGVRQPLRVYRALRASGGRSRLDVVPPHELTPLVGRDRELGLLRERWEQAKAGLGQVVLLTGEAGIGKSRLAAVLKDYVVGDSSMLWECQCSPLHQHSALYPLIDLLQRVLQWQRHDASAAKLQKLEATVARYALAAEETVPLVAALLSLALPTDRYPPLTLSPERQKQRTMAVLLTWLLKVAEQQPMCVMLEDLQWGDPSTLELLTLLIDQVPTTRLLILLLARSELRPFWALRAHFTQITLSRLSRVQVETMIAQITGDKALPAEVLQHIVTKTDGVPLFVEELTKMVLESGWLQEQEGHYALTSPLPPLAIPATLHDSLMARLDRLATAKSVVQLGATLGRAFPYEWLREVSPWNEATLQHELARLVAVELLYQRGVPPRATYSFKHALIQEAAYQSLLKSTRQRYHRHLAQVLETRFPDTAETQSELLAHHYTAAGCTEQAVHYWQRAGQHASDRSAHLEAVSHLTTGIELLTTLPETPERTQHALTLYIALGAALLVTKGQAAPEVEHVYAHARALCQQMGETPQLVPVLFGLWRCYATQPQHQTARELGVTLLRLAQRAHDPALAVLAHYALGVTWFYLGALPQARQHLEEGMARYTPDLRRALVFRIGQDPGVGCRAFAALPHWFLGYPEQALACLHEALTLAHELLHPYSLAFARCWAAVVSQCRCDVSAVYEQAEAAVTLATEQGFPLWIAMGTTFRGWALAMQGQGEEGMAQIRQGIAAWRATGAALFIPYFCTVLADVCDHLGHTEDGLQALAEAHSVVEQHEECWWEAEVYRLRGVLLLRQTMPPQAEAEAWLQRALDVACRQEAKALELRAAMSLSRLWQQQGKRQEVYDLLAPIYHWFTEGFDTADLQEAKALLDALA
jgi:predicted ATPase